MSIRERRNRKDGKGKTPEQIRKLLARHEQTYAEAIEGLHENDLPLSGAGYMMGIKAMLEGPAFTEP